MKKVLLASTALVAFTGAAAAEVALSGSAEIGVAGSTTSDVQFHTDIDVTFTMSGETDNGLTFGASIDLDESIGDANAQGATQESQATRDDSQHGGATIFISGAFGTVTVGDTDGALDWAMTEAGNINNGGSIADDETAHPGYLGSYLDGSNGNDGQIVRYDYTAGDFGIAISLEDDDKGGVNGNGDADGLDNNIGFAIGLRYTVDLGGTSVNLGAGYQVVGVNAEAGGVSRADAEAIGLSVGATLASGLSLGLAYTDFEDHSVDGQGVDNHVGVGVGYTTGALTLHANYGKYDVNDGSGDRDGFGVSVAYDLGGGASVHAGYGQGDDNGSEVKSASIGLGLSF